jgi:hypothetical protein
MMKDDNVLAALKKMTLHCRNPTSHKSVLVDIVAQYLESPTKEERKILDRRFECSYSTLVRLVGEKPAEDFLNSTFKNLRHRAYPHQGHYHRRH